MKLDEFIRGEMEAILQEWENFARSLPPGESMDVSGLRDHARQILEAIAGDMGHLQTDEEQSGKSRGQGRENTAALEFARKHASTRRLEGFDLNEVLSEYRALRTSVIQLWTRNTGWSEPRAMQQLIRFNEAMDQSLTYMANQYSRLVEEQRECSERSLREADLRKDEFLATLAHELRNPLAPVQTGIEVLRLLEDLSPAAQRPLEMMTRQMAHLVRLVDDLMDISRIGRGKISLQLGKVDIAQALREALEATRQHSCQGERRISLELPLEPVYVDADPVRLVQVVSNLLSNACKHTALDARIWLSASREGQKVKVVVGDDGAGIAAEDQKNIFDLFMQVHSSPKEGLGIGLALVRKLVELHGGSVEVHSAGPGCGSEFVVCLPLLADTGAAQPAPAETARHLGGRRVLVVDDNEDAAESLGLLLGLLGAEVRTVHGGAAALEQLEGFQPEMILLDIGMPDMDGYEAARRIRAHPAGKDALLVALTGLSQEQDRRRSLQSGFNRHLVKPVGLAQLQSAFAALDS